MNIDSPELLCGGHSVQRLDGFFIVEVFRRRRAVPYHPGVLERP